MTNLLPLLVFLDIDGVLNSHLMEIKAEQVSVSGMELSPTLISNLRRLLTATNAKVVIHSDWRERLPRQQLIDIFENYLQVPVDVADSDLRLKKIEVIGQYLVNHPNCRWVIIDDDQLMEINHPLFNHQYKTSYYRGLDDSAAKELLEKIKTL